MAEGQLLLSFQMTLFTFLNHRHYHVLLSITWVYNLDVIFTLDFPLCFQGCADTSPVASPRHAFPTIHTTRMLFPLMSWVLQHLFLGKPSLSPPLGTQLFAKHTVFLPHHCWSHSPPIFSLWLPTLTPCFMPGSCRRALRQGPPWLCISAASGSWVMTAGPRLRIATTCKADSSPSQRRPEAAVLKSLFINQCEMCCLSIAPSRHTSA